MKSAKVAEDVSFAADLLVARRDPAVVSCPAIDESWWFVPSMDGSRREGGSISRRSRLIVAIRGESCSVTSLVGEMERARSAWTMGERDGTNQLL